MSDEQIASIETKLNILNKVVKLGWALIVGAFVIGAWVTVLELRTHDNTHNITALKSNMQDVILWKTATDANQYTSKEHNTFATEIHSALNATNVRITRLEDIAVDTKEILKKLSTNQTTQNSDQN